MTVQGTSTLPPKLAAFLSLIAWSEGTSTDPLTRADGYDVVVSGVGGSAIFTDFSTHPFANRQAVLVRRGPPALYSTAAGRYQILLRIWQEYAPKLGFRDFGPRCQDAIALQLIRERFEISRIAELGEIAEAILACSSAWASFPASRDDQPTHSLHTLLERYGIILAALQH